MRRISIAFVVILSLFAFIGRVAAQSPTPPPSTPTPRPLPIPTPYPQSPPTPMTPTTQGDQPATWLDDVLKWVPCLSLLTAWVLAYVAWQRWRKDREANALDQLYQKYQDSEFADALKKVGEFKWDEDNRYSRARAFLFDDHEREERDKARRIVTTFWYRVAFLLDQGIINDENTFVLFGPPDIVEKLEALEVVKADRIGISSFPIEWPPLVLPERNKRYRTWKRYWMRIKRCVALLNRIRKAKSHFPTLPSHEEEFEEWKKESHPSQ